MLTYNVHDTKAFLRFVHHSQAVVAPATCHGHRDRVAKVMD